MQRPSVTQFQGLRFRSFFPGLSAARFFGGTDGVQLCLVSVAFLIVLYGWLLRKAVRGLLELLDASQKRHETAVPNIPNSLIHF